MDEDFIDEIYTNNESDVGCLNHFLTSVTQNRTKEEMAEALEKMGLMDEAKAVLKLPDRSRSPEVGSIWNVCLLGAVGMVLINSVIFLKDGFEIVVWSVLYVCFQLARHV